jgi:acyl dehydratase
VLEIRVHFVKAVKFGDTIRAIQRIMGKKETSKTDRGVLTSQVTVLNQDDQAVLEADLVALLYRRGFTPMAG